MLLLLLQRLTGEKKMLTPQTRSKIYGRFEGTFYLHIPGVTAVNPLTSFFVFN